MRGPLTTTQPNRTLRELGLRGISAVVLSLLVNWLLLGVVLFTDLVSPFDPLNFIPVTLLTAAGAIGAVIVYALVDRRSSTPDRTFAVVAVVVLLLSFIPDFALLALDDDATVGAVLVLMVMHVTVAVICIETLTDYVIFDV